MCNYATGNYGEHFEYGSVVQEMSFKDISYLELWWPLCLAEWNHLLNFGIGHSDKSFWRCLYP